MNNQNFSSYLNLEDGLKAIQELTEPSEETVRPLKLQKNFSLDQETWQETRDE